MCWFKQITGSSKSEVLVSMTSIPDQAWLAGWSWMCSSCSLGNQDGVRMIVQTRDKQQEAGPWHHP